MMLLLKMCAATFIVLLVVSPPNKVDPQKVGTLSDWRAFNFYIYVCILFTVYVSIIISSLFWQSVEYAKSSFTGKYV